MELLKPKVEASGLVDVALLGLSKSLTERALAPYIGDATLKSGAIKLVGGSALHSMGVGGKIGKIIGGGMVVDGMEDVIVSFLGGGIGLGAGARGSGEVW